MTQRRRTGSAASRPCSSVKCQMDRLTPLPLSNGVHPASKVGEHSHLQTAQDVLQAHLTKNSISNGRHELELWWREPAAYRSARRRRKGWRDAGVEAGSVEGVLVLLLVLGPMGELRCRRVSRRGAEARGRLGVGSWHRVHAPIQGADHRERTAPGVPPRAFTVCPVGARVSRRLMGHSSPNHLAQHRHPGCRVATASSQARPPYPCRRISSLRSWLSPCRRGLLRCGSGVPG